MSNRKSTTSFASESIDMVSDFIQTIDAVQGLAALTRPGRAWYEDVAPGVIDHIVSGLMGCLTNVSETIESVGEGFFSDEEIELLTKAEEVAIDLAIHRGARGIDIETGKELKGEALKAKMMELRITSPKSLGKFHETSRGKKGESVEIPVDLQTQIKERLKNPNLDAEDRARLENILRGNVF